MQPKWNKYEAAILLEAVIRVENKQEGRKEAIRRVSNMLRKMAISHGENIDEIYRNINGITFQFQSMEYSAFGKVSPTNKVGTKLFDEIVALRKNKPEEYKQILTYALEKAESPALDEKTMAIGTRKSNNKVQFRKWLLDAGEKENFVNWILICFDEVSDYAINQKKSINTVWEINNLKQYNTFVNTLQGFNFFRVLHKDLSKFLRNYAKLYAKFLKFGVKTLDESNKVELHEYVVTEKDMELNALYPEAFKQVYSLLKENYKHAYLTLDQVIEDYDISKEAMLNILSFASWAERLGEGYILGRNNSAKVVQSVSITIERAYKAPSEIESVLISAFKRGYRPNSIMDRRRFESLFEEQYGKIVENDEILSYINQKCFVFDERFFLPKAIVEKDIAIKLVKYIEEYFKNYDVLFYNVLFEKFKDLFNSYIYSTEMLVEYMKVTFDGTPLYYENKYFSYKIGTKPNIAGEVENYLISADEPCSYEDIYSKLSHLDHDDIYSVLHFNNPQIMGNSKTEYFHVDVAHISENDKKVFVKICETLLKDSKYITCNEIVDNLVQVDEDLYEKLVTKFSVLGIRRILTYYLRAKYDVATGVITRKGEQMKIADVFADYAKGHTYFTVANVQELANYIGTAPYWEVIHQNAIRINRDEFVSEDAVEFDIESVDSAISFYCDDYLPIGEIVEFMRFPVCGYPWNTYLLQQYIFRFSKLFELKFLGFTKSSAAGVIVKKQTTNFDFESIVIDALARTNITSKNDALDYLCKRGFITDRRYKKVEELLKKAIVNRNKNDEM
ncbi:MAG: hypothetical protein IJZ53_08475 [Tyzzerella sp.]|nr:hypothetical protein [Tyzzerella sp.]